MGFGIKQKQKKKNDNYNFPHLHIISIKQKASNRNSLWNNVTVFKFLAINTLTEIKITKVCNQFKETNPVFFNLMRKMFSSFLLQVLFFCVPIKIKKLKTFILRLICFIKKKGKCLVILYQLSEKCPAFFPKPLPILHFHWPCMRLSCLHILAEPCNYLSFCL